MNNEQNQKKSWWIEKFCDCFTILMLFCMCIDEVDESDIDSDNEK